MYYVSYEVEHACCYEAVVRFKAGEQDYLVCECKDEDTAEMIAKALNDTGEK